MIIGLSIVAGVAAATRVATMHPLVAATTVGLGSVAVAVIGLGLHTRRSRRWRIAWALLGLALLCLAGSTLLVAVGAAGAAPVVAIPQALGVLGRIGAVAGLTVLVGYRLPGRALDVLFEAAIIALGTAVAAWSVLVAPVEGVATPQAVWFMGLPTLDAVMLWLAFRLVFLSLEHPAAFRYLIGAMVCLTTVDAVAGGAFLVGATMPAEYLDALTLWAYCLWGTAALHPSLRASFEPVPAVERGLTAPQILLACAGILIAPAVSAVQTLRGEPLGLLAALAGPTVLSALVVGYLLRQVQERAGREYRAQHDPLTGLPNRVLFHDRVETALAHARRSGGSLGVMFLDLDRFKEVNDSLGHDVGNLVLQAVARRLRGCLREEDTLARMGGDEFTILVGDIDGDGCLTVARKLLAALERPLIADGRELHVSTSIGVATYPDDGRDAQSLLKNADTAMYRAKARGRNVCQRYTHDMSARAQVKLSLESSLHTAIERDELLLHYQPKVDQHDGALVGVEALLRWRHPRLGYIPPSAFIPLAEESGLIMPLGEWVLGEACGQHQRWVDAGVLRVPLAVNFSARQFAQQHVDELIDRTLDETGLSAELLEVELTETVFHRDIEATTAILHKLRTRGIRCSIDDFGTGFSGLKYLAEMPIDALKIDRSFVQRIGDGAEASPIVTAVIALAHNLGLQVIAEGVETAAQARFLLAHGCRLAQGFLYGAPLDAPALEEWVGRNGVQQAERPSQHAASELPARQGAAATPVAAFPGLADAAATEAFLKAACRDNAEGPLDDELLAAVLTALQDRVKEGRTGPPRSLSMRLAAGTFAGLMPLTGGLAASNSLPAPGQDLAKSLFAHVGIDLPTVPAGVERPPAWAFALGPQAAEDPRALREVATVDPDEAVGRPSAGAEQHRAGLTPTPSGSAHIATAPPEREEHPAREGPGRDASRPTQADDSAPTGRGVAQPPGRSTAPSGGGGTPTQPAASPGHGHSGSRPAAAPPAVDTPSPGHGGSTPASDDTPPALDDTPPAPDDTPPGHAASPPGQGGSSPGHGSSPPGLANPPPGHGGSPPGLDDPPPGHGASPPGQGSAPPGLDDGLPPGQGASPPGLDEPPPGHGGSPPGLDDPPPGHGGSPPGLDDPPPGHGGSPPGLDDPPPGQNGAPSGDDV